MTELSSTKELFLASNIDSISEVESLIDEACEFHLLDEENFGNMLIAVTEAVNNAITHGNQLNPDKKVLLSLDSTSDNLIFVVSDEGKGFDFNNIPDPTLPENIENIRGRGVFLMNHLADSVSYNDIGSSVTLTFCKSNK